MAAIESICVPEHILAPGCVLNIFFIDDRHAEEKRKYIDENPFFRAMGDCRLKVDTPPTLDDAKAKLRQMVDTHKKAGEKKGLKGYVWEIEEKRRTVILLDYSFHGSGKFSGEILDGKAFVHSLRCDLGDDFTWLPPIVLLTEHTEELLPDLQDAGIRHFVPKYPVRVQSSAVTFAINILAVAGIHIPPDYIRLVNPEAYAKRISEKWLAGESPIMKAVIREQVLPAINSQKPVLILGETGTGKELVAQALHGTGIWNNKAMVIENCRTFAVTGAWAESRLFGCLTENKRGEKDFEEGVLRKAHLNDLFLDEVAEMPLESQTNFLRAVEQCRFFPLGTTQEAYSFFRLISATNQDVRSENNMRRDFLYRIGRLVIEMPPLRERITDIPLIWNRILLRRQCIHEDRPLLGIDMSNTDKSDPTTDVANFLSQEDYRWPANAREIEFMIDNLLSLKNAGVLQVPKARQLDIGWLVSADDLAAIRRKFTRLVRS